MKVLSSQEFDQKERDDSWKFRNVTAILNNLNRPQLVTVHLEIAGVDRESNRDTIRRAEDSFEAKQNSSQNTNLAGKRKNSENLFPEKQFSALNRKCYILSGRLRGIVLPPDPGYEDQTEALKKEKARLELENRFLLERVPLDHLSKVVGPEQREKRRVYASA
ncbi:hypothetical protein G5I_11636 [Acromyrmex echinatior]|uniref:Uncharacterized protein n=1 Tax=Acromyrmex echinatior TaxID=103372 RepID=F4X049_ACREC|nr:hypothetical protein G5I_11636 [Acromyrmex echinatior]